MEKLFAKYGLRVHNYGDRYVVSDSIGTIMEVRRQGDEYIISTQHGDKYTASDKDLHNTLKMASAEFFDKELKRLGLSRVVRIGKANVPTMPRGDKMLASIMPTSGGYSVAYIQGGRVIHITNVDRSWLLSFAAVVKGIKI